MNGDIYIVEGPPGEPSSAPFPREIAHVSVSIAISCNRSGYRHDWKPAGRIVSLGCGYPLRVCADCGAGAIWKYSGAGKYHRRIYPVEMAKLRDVPAPIAQAAATPAPPTHNLWVVAELASNLGLKPGEVGDLVARLLAARCAK